jgi:hypothetical protein
MTEERTIPKYLNEFDEISSGLAAQEVGFLFGAGMSDKSGIHMGAELAKRMLRSAVYGATRVEEEAKEIDDIAIKYPFEAISEYCRTKTRFKNLSEWLLEHGGFKKAKPTTAHEGLFELYEYLETRFPSILFTTNFDHLIENSLGEKNAISVTIDNLQDLHKAKEEGKVAVVHLHGCIERPNTLITGEITQATLEGSLFDLFRAELAKDVFVFVGYSLADTNLRHIFFDVQRISRTRQGLEKDTYVVSPASGNPQNVDSESFIAKRIWEDRGATHLALSASDFFKSLTLATKNFVNFKAKQEVADRLVDGSLETLESMLESIAEKYRDLKADDFLLYLYYTLVPKK